MILTWELLNGMPSEEGRYTEMECLRSLSKAIEELGDAPTMNEYDSLNLSPAAKTVADRCGTWKLALAKLDAERDERREYTKENCINAIKILADDIGKEPSISDYSSVSYGPSISTIRAICGSWTEAKEIAGVSGMEETSAEEEADEFFDKLDEAGY